MGRKVAGIVLMAAVLWVGSSATARAQTCGEGAYSCDFVVEDFAAPWDSELLSAALAQASAEPLTICLAGTTTGGLRLLETLRTDVTICSLDGGEFVTQGALVEYDGEPGALRVVGPHFVTGGFPFDLSLSVGVWWNGSNSPMSRSSSTRAMLRTTTRWCTSTSRPMPWAHQNWCSTA